MTPLPHITQKYFLEGATLARETRAAGDWAEMPEISLAFLAHNVPPRSYYAKV